MFIDVVCLILVLWAAFKGLRNGFVVGLFSFLAFIIGLAAALKLSTLAAEYIGTNTSIGELWIPFIAFAAVFLIVVLLVRLGAKGIESVIRVALLGWLNKLGGVLLYLLLYLFIFSIILFYAEQLHLIKEEAMNNSVVYPYIKPLGPKFINALGYLIPFFKNMFTELELFFEGMAHKESLT
jgi:membrane protein required for colicin V production